MPRPHGQRFRRFLQVGSVELAQIPRHALLNLSQSALHLRSCEILVARVHGFEFATINGDARVRQQAQFSAQRNKPRAYLAYRRTVAWRDSLRLKKFLDAVFDELVETRLPMTEDPAAAYREHTARTTLPTG